MICPPCAEGTDQLLADDISAEHAARLHSACTGCDCAHRIDQLLTR